ncbi:MAG: diguanylate cyclase [Actinomycetota bacterium]|nr:diguanylate cyclase [Actinomycetota bacterium]
MRVLRLPARLRPRVGAKVALAVGALIPAVLMVALVGLLGLAETHQDVARLYSENIKVSEHTAAVSTALGAVAVAALEEIPTTAEARLGEQDAALDLVLLPRLTQALERLRQDEADDTEALQGVAKIQKGVRAFQLIRATGAYHTSGADAEAQRKNAVLAGRTARLFEELLGVSDRMQANEVADAAVSAREADRAYTSTVLRTIATLVVSLLLGLCVVVALIRHLVPRIRSYSHFATEVAAGRVTTALDPHGHDELAELGSALNDLVRQDEISSRHEEAQAEFIDTMQLTQNEDQAQDLLQRHLTRSLPDSEVTVLKRNNSANRLEAATRVLDPALATRLVGAEPGSCLALRFSRAHLEGRKPPPLLSCDLCGDRVGLSTCEPLLVGGEVIGSVLVTHPLALAAEEQTRFKNTVAQAAPMLANLRNLALAEFRASNDSLTGLPNKRASEDTLKRMVAQASRSITPMAAIMLDLDHFKQINDRFGHPLGDEVLAAVGTALQSCLRASDFAGRFGGEEFLILLPDTTVDNALLVAEQIRATVAEITVPGVERAITASLGIAALIEHSGNATGLLRHADLALYAAKAAGRNRALIASTGDDEEEPPADRIPPKRSPRPALPPADEPGESR